MQSAMPEVAARTSASDGGVNAAAWQHQTVLLHEAVDALVTDADGDLRRRHLRPRRPFARAARSACRRDGRLVALDRDPQAVARRMPARRGSRDPRFSIEHASFAAHAQRRWRAAASTRWTACCSTWASRSPQIDDPARGFSFRFDGPLDMRMDTTRGESAADFLARADERQIAEVIRDYGEERFAVQIAKALVARRESGRPVRTTARACRRRGSCGQDPRAGPEPCNAHISGSSDFRQRRA